MNRIIFNSSMPRSGSELLQVILHQNPNIYGSPTSPLNSFVVNMREVMQHPEVKSQPEELMRNAFVQGSLYFFQGYYDSITDRPIVCDKCRQWMYDYSLLSEIIHKTPYMFCMIRDLRDVFTSMEMNWRKNRHLPCGPDNPQTLQNMTLRERVGSWSHNHPVGYSAQRLKGAEEQGFTKDIYFIRYEDFTRNPDDCLRGLYDYLELPYFQHDYKNIIKEVEEDHRWHGPFGNHDVQKELKPSVSRYKEILGDDIGNEIISGFEWFYQMFYPEVLEQGES